MSWSGNFKRDVLTCTAVLTLGTVGNAILPIPSAFAVTGAVAGTLFITFVALSNVFTCNLLLRGASATGAVDYEGLSYAVGGFPLKVWSEVWIMILLLGTNMGALIQLGEGASFAISAQWPDAPEWLYARGGMAAVIFFTLCVIFPLSMLPNMRKLELVGACGSFVLWVLAGAVVIRSSVEGLPALKSGDWPAVGFTTLADISTAFSLFCFAFYHQVLMLPMLAEMPNEHKTAEGNAFNTSVIKVASTFTILVTSGLTYWFTGWFGAAMYGYTNTAGNVCENEWIPGVGTFILNLAITIYLAVSIPPILHANMHTANKWFIRLSKGKFQELPWWKRRAASLAAVGLPCLAVALALPSKSGTVLSVTGATGVAMMSYVMPVVIHFSLYFGKARCQSLAASGPGAAERGATTPPSDKLDKLDLAAHSPVHSHSEELPGEGGNEEPELVGFAGVAFAKDPEKEEQAEAVVAKEKDEEHERKLMRLRCETMYDPLPYRQAWHYKSAMVFMELLLPVVVLLVGFFFSITTLVYLWVPVGDGGGETVDVSTQLDLMSSPAP